MGLSFFSTAKIHHFPVFPTHSSKKLQRDQKRGRKNGLEFLSLFTVVPNADVVARRCEGVPRDVEPPVAGQQLVTAVGHVHHPLHRRHILRVLPQVKELRQHKVGR